MNQDELLVVLGRENIPLAQRLLEIGKTADDVRLSLEHAERETTAFATTALLATGATCAGIATSPALAPLAVVAGVGALLIGADMVKSYGVGKLKKERATLIAKAFKVVPPGQWQELVEASHGKAEPFLAALNWGIKCAASQGNTGEAVYRFAREYLGDAGYPVPGYKPRTLVSVERPKSNVELGNWEPPKAMLSAVAAYLAPMISDVDMVQIAKDAKDAGDYRRAIAILISGSKVKPNELDGITAGNARRLHAWANSPEPTKPVSLPSAQPTVEVLPPVSNAPVVIEDTIEDALQPGDAAFTDALLGMDDDEDCDDEPVSLNMGWEDLAGDAAWVEPADLGNINKYPIVMVVAGQGSGKTCTLAAIMEDLDGYKAFYTTKADDHRNPNVTGIYDLTFGYDHETRRGSWFGEPDVITNDKGKEQIVFSYDADDDFDTYLNNGADGGTALEFIHLMHRTAENRNSHGTQPGRQPWRVFYDEAAQTYTGGFVMLSQAENNACKNFISARLIQGFFNFRGAGVQLWIGCQSETVKSIGLEGCTEARDSSWHLYPGKAAIEVAKKHNKRDIVTALENLVHEGYAIALLEKGRVNFEIIKLPKLAEFAKYDPIEAPIPAAKPSKVVFKKPVAPVEIIDDGLTDDGYFIEEIPVLPSDPGERVKLASDLLKEHGALTIAQIREINPLLEQYFRTLAVKYSDKYKKSGDTYSYES